MQSGLLNDLGSVPSFSLGLLMGFLDSLGFCRALAVIMVEEDKLWAFTGMDFSDRDDGERSWAKVVQGSSRAPAWSSYKIFEEEIDHL